MWYLHATETNLWAKFNLQFLIYSETKSRCNYFWFGISNYVFIVRVCHLQVEVETSKYLPDENFMPLHCWNRLTWKHTQEMTRLLQWDLGKSKHLYHFMQAWVGLQNQWSSIYCRLLGHCCGRNGKISVQDESPLSSVVFVGMLMGACGWGFVSDKYGWR